MIIGSGDIAQVLPDRDDRLFFASGVSNSQETEDSAYWRELRLLLDQDFSQHIVYFSTLAIFYNNTRYVEHKMEAEALVKSFHRYTIVRIGNITWGNNPNTLINNLRNKIKQGKPYDIEDTYRFIVDKEEFLYWISMIPDFSCEMNIPGKRMKVKDIVKEYCYD